MKATENQLEAERIINARQLRDLRSLADPQEPLQMVFLSPVNPARRAQPAGGVVVLDPEGGRGQIQLYGAFGEADDRDYQLWIDGPGPGYPARCGVFHVAEADQAPAPPGSPRSCRRAAALPHRRSQGRIGLARRGQVRGSNHPCKPPRQRKNFKPMIIKPKVRGFVCVTAHPAGCAAHIGEWISYVKSRGSIPNGPKRVLVIGASTGYGLASRVTAAFGSGAATLGIFFERPSEEGRTATPGWYNSIGFTNAAHAAGLYAKNINGDAFSDAIKAQALETIRSDMGQVDLVIYSLASPRRTHPKTGRRPQVRPQARRRPVHEQDRRHGQGRREHHHDRARERAGDSRHGRRHGRRGLGDVDRRCRRRSSSPRGRSPSPIPTSAPR